MNRWLSITTAALVLALLATGSVLAGPQPTAPAPSVLADEPEEGPLSDEQVTRVVERLERAGLVADPGVARDLAAAHGVGGAARILAWDAQLDAVSADQIAQMRADGTGWGEIARELGVHPGMGPLMRGGRGPDGDGPPGLQRAPGQQRGGDD